MAQTGGRLSLYIFILVLNLVFPVLGYTFTTFGEDYGDFEVSLDSDALMMSGIELVDAESDNLTYNGAWAYFEVENKTTRFRFMDDIKDPSVFPIKTLGDGINTQRQTAIAKVLNTWYSKYRIPVKGVKSGLWLKAMFNSSIINEWDTQYNWSRFVLYDGTNIFITPFSGGNITDAVYVTAKVNITVAKTIDESSTFNFWQFLGWYSSLMMGTASWGLPPVFAWVIKIFSALSVLAMVLLTKEMVSGWL